MLDITKISNSCVHEESWRKERFGKITASVAGHLIGEGSDKGKFSKTATTILEGLAGERLTGTPAKQEFFTDATNHGNSTEPESIDAFCRDQNKFVLRNEDAGDTHRLILYDEFCACTPDGIVVDNPDNIFNAEGTHIKASTLECKNPFVHHEFIKLYKCLTPIDLKNAKPLYYWQVLCQMLFCNVLVGYFAAYSPIFKKIRVIKFNKMELRDDLKKLNLTVEYAKQEINKIVELFKN